MRKNKIILYKGQRHFVECAIRANGKSDSKDFLDSLGRLELAKILRVIKRFADFAVIHSKEQFRKVEGPIWEFKNYQTRILMYHCDRQCIALTHGFFKKGGKIPKKEIDKANQIMGEYNSVRGGLLP